MRRGPTFEVPEDIAEERLRLAALEARLVALEIGLQEYPDDLGVAWLPTRVTRVDDLSRGFRRR